MKIAVLLPTLSGGGAEYVGMEWAAGLRALNHQVDMIVTHAKPNDLKKENTTALQASGFGPRLYHLRRSIKRGGYDAVISLMPHWNVLAIISTLFLSRRVQTIVSAHSLEAGMLRTHGISFLGETLLAKVFYRFADSVIAVSHPVGAEIRQKYGVARERLWVVPNPVFRVTPSPGETVFTRTDRNALSLVFAGRLVKQKRPELVLESAALLKKQYGIDASVDFFGEGSEEESLRSTALVLGVQATFHGWSLAWSQSCPNNATLVMPSLVEGFGNVLVEAAQAGIPSVASSKALGVADAIIPGVTGVYSPGDEAGDLCEAIVQAQLLETRDISSWLNRFSRDYAAHILDRILLRQEQSTGTNKNG